MQKLLNGKIIVIDTAQKRIKIEGCAEVQIFCTSTFERIRDHFSNDNYHGMIIEISVYLLKERISAYDF